MSAALRTALPAVSRMVVAVAVVVGFVVLAVEGDTRTLAAPPDDQVSPLPAADVPCRLTGSEALAHAVSLEQLATARWQRVPFALREAPRAALQMAEAEACYAAANERAGRMRSAAARRAYGAEIARRFARARLLLRTSLARREAGGASSCDGRAEIQVATLLALLERAPPSAEPYRRELTRLSLRCVVEAAPPRGTPHDASKRLRFEEDE